MKNLKIIAFALLGASTVNLAASSEMTGEAGMVGGFGGKRMGVTYQKPKLEKLKAELDAATTPQEKQTALENAKAHATYGTLSAIERANYNLDQASQIIQDELDKYNQ